MCGAHPSGRPGHGGSGAPCAQLTPTAGGAPWPVELAGRLTQHGVPPRSSEKPVTRFPVRLGEGTVDRFLPVIFCMAVSGRPPGHFPLTSEAARCPGRMAPSHLHNELLCWGLVTREPCLSLVVWGEAPGRGDLQKDPAWAGPHQHGRLRPHRGEKELAAWDRPAVSLSYPGIGPLPGKGPAAGGRSCLEPKWRSSPSSRLFDQGRVPFCASAVSFFH